MGTIRNVLLWTDFYLVFQGRVLRSEIIFEKCFLFHLWSFRKTAWLEQGSSKPPCSETCSKSMTSELGKQTIAIHLLPNISRSKSNQAMKFSSLIEYNIRSIFLEKSYTKCGGETIPRSFFRNQNWPYLWINSLKLYAICFYCMLSWGLLKYIKTRLKTNCYFLM